MADAEDQVVRAQLRAKYPDRVKPLPHRVTKGDPIPSLAGFRDSLINMKGGISPGCGGLRQEYLVVLGRQLSDNDMKLMEEFGMKYLRGGLPGWFYRCWLTVQCVPLFKCAARENVRPLGLRNPLVKSFHKEVSKSNREVIKSVLEPQQMVLSQGGGAKLVFSVRGLVELIKPGSNYEDWAVVKIDIRNAYNEMSRAETIRVMEADPSLRHLAAYSGVTLAPYSGLESGGRLWGSTGEGGTQGDSKTTDDFTVTLQPSVVKLDTACHDECGGIARGGADDIFAFAQRDVAVRVVNDFAAEVRERCGLEVQWGKTEIYSLLDALPEGAPPGMTVAGQDIEGSFVRGFLCWGVPVGEDRYVSKVLDDKVTQILAEGRCSLEVLGLKHRHAAWIGLKQSVWQRFEYWCQNCYPSLTLPAAARLDQGLHSLLEMVVGLQIPLGAHLDTTVINTPVASREGWSFPAWVLRQPIKGGGAGLRSFTELCRPAFVGAVELAIPSLHTGFCPILTPLVGGEEHFGEGWDGRWRPLLDSGCRAGRELASAWDWLQQETIAAKAYLGEAGEETVGPLCQPVESAGEGCTTGKTRTKLVEEREILMGRVLARALEQRNVRDCREALSWPQRDKLSSQWLLNLPGHNSTLSPDEFSQAFSVTLCLPSPACADPLRLGQRVGRRTLDKYGDNVAGQTLVGDGFRTRHDEIKRELLSLMRWGCSARSSTSLLA